MDKKETRNQKIFAGVLVILVLMLGVYKLFFDNNKQKTETIDTKKISVVTDRNAFYTVSGCVTKFLTYLDGNNQENVYDILDEGYVKENDITLNNLNQFVAPFDRIMNFLPKKMYVQQLSKTIYKYYVYGKIYEDILDTLPEYQDYYIIVMLDRSELTYSIEPYNGKMFK